MGRSLASSGSVLGFQFLSVHEPTPVAGCRPAWAAGLWTAVMVSAATATPVRKIVGFQPIIGTPAARVHGWHRMRHRSRIVLIWPAAGKSADGKIFRFD